MAIEADYSRKHYLGFDNFVESSLDYCAYHYNPLSVENIRQWMPCEQQSLVQAGKKQWFLWVKHSIRTFKKSHLDVFLSYMLPVCKYSKTFRQAAAMGLKGLHRLYGPRFSGSGFHQAMTFRSYPVYCNCRKKHFLFMSVTSATTKMEPGTKYMETKYRLYHIAWVCVCVHIYSCAHYLSCNLFCPSLALSMSRKKCFSIFPVFSNGFSVSLFFIFHLIWI